MAKLQSPETRRRAASLESRRKFYSDARNYFGAVGFVTLGAAVVPPALWEPLCEHPEQARLFSDAAGNTTYAVLGLASLFHIQQYRKGNKLQELTDEAIQQESLF